MTTPDSKWSINEDEATAFLVPLGFPEQKPWLESLKDLRSHFNRYGPIAVMAGKDKVRQALRQTLGEISWRAALSINRRDKDPTLGPSTDLFPDAPLSINSFSTALKWLRAVIESLNLPALIVNGEVLKECSREDFTLYTSNPTMHYIIAPFQATNDGRWYFLLWRTRDSQPFLSVGREHLAQEELKKVDVCCDRLSEMGSQGENRGKKAIDYERLLFCDVPSEESGEHSILLILALLESGFDLSGKADEPPTPLVPPNGMDSNRKYTLYINKRGPKIPCDVKLSSKYRSVWHRIAVQYCNAAFLLTLEAQKFQAVPPKNPSLPSEYQGFLDDPLVLWLKCPQVSAQQRELIKPIDDSDNWCCITCGGPIAPDCVLVEDEGSETKKKSKKKHHDPTVDYPKWNAKEQTPLVRRSIRAHEEDFHPGERFVGSLKDYELPEDPDCGKYVATVPGVVRTLFRTTDTKCPVLWQEMERLRSVDYLTHMVELRAFCAYIGIEHRIYDFLKHKIVTIDNVPANVPSSPPPLTSKPKPGSVARGGRLPLNSKSPGGGKKRKAELQKDEGGSKDKKAKHSKAAKKKPRDPLRVKGGNVDKVHAILLLKAHAIVYIRCIRNAILKTIREYRSDIERFLQVCPLPRLRNLFDLTFADLRLIEEGRSPFVHPTLTPVKPPDNPQYLPAPLAEAIASKGFWWAADLAAMPQRTTATYMAPDIKRAVELTPELQQLPEVMACLLEATGGVGSGPDDEADQRAII